MISAPRSQELFRRAGKDKLLYYAYHMLTALRAFSQARVRAASRIGASRDLKDHAADIVNIVKFTV